MPASSRPGPAAKPALRLIDCERNRLNQERAQAASTFKCLFAQAHAGKLARAVVIYDNGPESPALFASTMGHASRQALRESLALAQQYTARVLALLEDFDEGAA